MNDDCVWLCFISYSYQSYDHVPHSIIIMYEHHAVMKNSNGDIGV